MKSGKPKQTNLRRASSTVYYAMFHCLARCGADLLVGGRSATRSDEAWKQVYRALEHKFTKNACTKTDIVTKFPNEIQEFAQHFATMQVKRHKSDYDPNFKVYKSSVEQDISDTEVVIKRFNSAPRKDRRAFAAYVLFRTRND